MARVERSFFVLGVLAAATVVAALWSTAPPAGAGGLDYCAAFPASASEVSGRAGTGCRGRVPGQATDGIVVEIAAFGSATEADAYAEAYPNRLGGGGDCTPYQSTDGTLTEVFVCTQAASIWVEGPVVITARQSPPVGTVDGQVYWSETTSVVRTIANRLGSIPAGEGVDEGETQAPPESDPSAPSDEADPLVGVVTIGGVVAGGVLVGRVVRRRGWRRRSRSSGGEQPTVDPCVALGSKAQQIDDRARRLGSVAAARDRLLEERSELEDHIRTRQRYLFHLVKDNVIPSGQRVLHGTQQEWGGVSTVIAGAAEVPAAAAETIGVSVRRSGLTRAAGGIGALTTLSGAALAGTSESQRSHIHHVHEQIGLAVRRHSSLTEQILDRDDEVVTGVRELRRQAERYFRELYDNGCPKVPVSLGLLDDLLVLGSLGSDVGGDASLRDRLWPEDEPPDHTKLPTCHGLDEAIAEFHRAASDALARSGEVVARAKELRSRARAARSAETLLRSELAAVERSIDDVQGSRLRWAGYAAVGTVAGGFVSGGVALTLFLSSTAANVRAGGISVRDADLALRGRLRALLDEAERVKRDDVAGIGELTRERDALRAPLERQYGLLRHAFDRCGGRTASGRPLGLPKMPDFEPFDLGFDPSLPGATSAAAPMGQIDQLMARILR